MKVVKPTLPLALLFLVAALAIAASGVVFVLGAGVGLAAEPPEVIVVTGRLPGPPLWKVSNGDNTLWIFPSLAQVPKRMQWDSARVERVLAEAEIYLTQPSAAFNMSSTGLKALRGEGELNERLSHTPDNKKLQEVLSSELYARYAALKARYFPRNDDIDELRPLYAMQRMRDEVQQETGLASPNAIFDQIEKLARKNRKLQRIDASATLEVKLPFDEAAERMQTMMNSLGADKERDCFELELSRMEVDLDAIKRRANEWANGRIDEFRAVQLRNGENPCMAMFSVSSEGEALEALERHSREKWLSGAEESLMNHLVGFSVLDIGELLSENGLLSRLQEKGYAVRAP